MGLILVLEEAGIAFGMTKWERLKKFEIPLAMPVIDVRGSDCSGNDYRDCDLGSLDWGWRTWFLYPSRY